MTPAKLEELLAHMTGKRVLCVGDLLLDRFVYGSAGRVSREAPVVALREDRRETMLGAAGNVARNVAALGGEPVLAAVVGDDPEGHELSKAVETSAIQDVELITARGRSTPTKTRFVASGQQVLCVDRDPGAALDESSQTLLIDAALGVLDDVDAVIVSDYGRGGVSAGVVRAVIDAAGQRSLKVIVDPRGRDFSRYDGAYLLKPNAQELSDEAGAACGGEEEAAAALRTVMGGLQDLDHLLVTRGGQGMSLLSRGGEVETFRSQPRDVYDVSGAGDTTIAALGLAIASGADLRDAIRLANHAGGVVVTKVGTAAARADELIADAVEGCAAAVAADINEAAERVARWRADGLRIGLTNGCFDIVHVGHVKSLSRARALCDRLIVGVNSDASVKRLKGPERPINAARDRAALLAALDPVDLVVVFEEDTATKLVEALRPDVYVKGGDYDVESLPEAAAVRAIGGEIVLTPLEPGLSTTGLIERIGETGAS